MKNSVVLLLGGNLGPVKQHLQQARQLINDCIGEVVAGSSVHCSQAWGFHSDNVFYNQVLLCHTLLSPEEVLSEIWKIERFFGRKRDPNSLLRWREKGRAYTSRAMDIDILFYNNAVIETDLLVIPHPLLHERLFVLNPLVEILPNQLHPLFLSTVRELKIALEGRLAEERALRGAVLGE